MKHIQAVGHTTMYIYSWENLKTIGQIIEVFEVMKTTQWGYGLRKFLGETLSKQNMLLYLVLATITSGIIVLYFFSVIPSVLMFTKKSKYNIIHNL